MEVVPAKNDLRTQGVSGEGMDRKIEKARFSRTQLLGGGIASTSGRLSVGAKSPLTNGIKEASAGGTAGHA